MSPTRRILTLALVAALAGPALAGPASAGPPPGPALAQGGLAQGGLAAADRALVDKATAYLQSLGEARGRFVQTNARGQSAQGTLFLKRPGKARFEYDAPSGLVVVSDGARVTVADNRLKTFSRYPLGATPLSLFLAKNIRLDRGVVVTGVERRPDGFVIAARDGQRKTAGQLTLSFADNPMQLTGWAATDAQGRTTRVQLMDLQPTSALDKALFVARDPRLGPAAPAM